MDDGRKFGDFLGIIMYRSWPVVIELLWCRDGTYVDATVGGRPYPAPSRTCRTEAIIAVTRSQRPQGRQEALKDKAAQVVFIPPTLFFTADFDRAEACAG